MWKVDFTKYIDDEELFFGPTMANNKLWLVTNQGNLFSFSYNGIFEKQVKLNLSDIIYRPIVVKKAFYFLSNKAQMLVIK